MFVTVLFLLFLVNLKPEKEVHEKDGTIRKPSRARHTMRLVVTRVVPALLVIVITAGGFFLQFKDKDFRLRKGNCLQLGRISGSGCSGYL